MGRLDICVHIEWRESLRYLVKTNSEISKYKCISCLDLGCQAKTNYVDICFTNTEKLITINQDSPRRLMPHRLAHYGC